MEGASRFVQLRLREGLLEQPDPNRLFSKFLPRHELTHPIMRRMKFICIN